MDQSHRPVFRHLHKCKEHSNCVVLFEKFGQSTFQTHLMFIDNIDHSCPYHGLHLMQSISDECFAGAKTCANETCRRRFTPTEDLRQLYCSQACAKAQMSRRRNRKRRLSDVKPP